jgi:hypothetical protein
MVELKENIVGFTAAYYWSSTTYFVIMLDRSPSVMAIGLSMQTRTLRSVCVRSGLLKF